MKDRIFDMNKLFLLLTLMTAQTHMHASQATQAITEPKVVVSKLDNNGYDRQTYHQNGTVVGEVVYPYEGKYYTYYYEYQQNKKLGELPISRMYPPTISRMYPPNDNAQALYNVLQYQFEEQEKLKQNTKE